VVYEGDKLPVAGVTVDLGLNYSFDLWGGRSRFARIDQYSGPYHRTTEPGTLTYGPDIYKQGKTEVVNGGVGAKLGRAEVSLFVNNLFNSQDVRWLDGGRGCGDFRDPACSAPVSINYQQRGVTFRPREVGVTASYRY
jgi:outer membrane receptor protein involved in Fe transport